MGTVRQRFINCEQKYVPLPGGRETCAVFTFGDPSKVMEVGTSPGLAGGLAGLQPCSG